jgi:predicted  nucleic acid-binding Zn-ribbon protein
MGVIDHHLLRRSYRMEFNRVTAAVQRAATQIDEVAAALRFAGQDKNEPEFLNKNFSKLEQASNALRDAIDDPVLEDIGASSVDSANNNPDFVDPEQDKAEAKELKAIRGTRKDVRKGGELESPANDSTTL